MQKAGPVLIGGRQIWGADGGTEREGRMEGQAGPDVLRMDEQSATIWNVWAPYGINNLLSGLGRRAVEAMDAITKKHD